MNLRISSLPFFLWILCVAWIGFSSTTSAQESPDAFFSIDGFAVFDYLEIPGFERKSSEDFRKDFPKEMEGRSVLVKADAPAEVKAFLNGCIWAEGRLTLKKSEPLAGIVRRLEPVAQRLSTKSLGMTLYFRTNRMNKIGGATMVALNDWMELKGLRRGDYRLSINEGFALHFLGMHWPESITGGQAVEGGSILRSPLNPMELLDILRPLSNATIESPEQLQRYAQLQQRLGQELVATGAHGPASLIQVLMQRTPWVVVRFLKYLPEQEHATILEKLATRLGVNTAALEEIIKLAKEDFSGRWGGPRRESMRAMSLANGQKIRDLMSSGNPARRALFWIVLEAVGPEALGIDTNKINLIEAAFQEIERLGTQSGTLESLESVSKWLANRYDHRLMPRLVQLFERLESTMKARPNPNTANVIFASSSAFDVRLSANLANSCIASLATSSSSSGAGILSAIVALTKSPVRYRFARVHTALAGMMSTHYSWDNEPSHRLLDFVQDADYLTAEQSDSLKKEFLKMTAVAFEKSANGYAPEKVLRNRFLVESLTLKEILVVLAMEHVRHSRYLYTEGYLSRLDSFISENMSRSAFVRGEVLQYLKYGREHSLYEAKDAKKLNYGLEFVLVDRAEELAAESSAQTLAEIGRKYGIKSLFQAVAQNAPPVSFLEDPLAFLRQAGASVREQCRLILMR